MGHDPGPGREGRRRVLGCLKGNGGGGELGGRYHGLLGRSGGLRLDGGLGRSDGLGRSGLRSRRGRLGRSSGGSRRIVHEPVSDKEVPHDLPHGGAAVMLLLFLGGIGYTGKG